MFIDLIIDYLVINLMIRKQALAREKYVDIYVFSRNIERTIITVVLENNFLLFKIYNIKLFLTYFTFYFTIF